MLATRFGSLGGLMDMLLDPSRCLSICLGPELELESLSQQTATTGSVVFTATLRCFAEYAARVQR